MQLLVVRKRSNQISVVFHATIQALSTLEKCSRLQNLFCLFSMQYVASYITYWDNGLSVAVYWSYWLLEVSYENTKSSFDEHWFIELVKKTPWNTWFSSRYAIFIYWLLTLTLTSGFTRLHVALRPRNEAAELVVSRLINDQLLTRDDLRRTVPRFPISLSWLVA